MSLDRDVCLLFLFRNASVSDVSKRRSAESAQSQSTPLSSEHSASQPNIASMPSMTSQLSAGSSESGSVFSAGKSPTPSAKNSQRLQHSSDKMSMSMTSVPKSDVTPDEESCQSLPVDVGNFDDDVTVKPGKVRVYAGDDVSIASEVTDATSIASFGDSTTSSVASAVRGASPLKTEKPKSRSLPRGVTPPPVPPARSDSERKAATRYTSRSQETLLSGDSGFSQLSHATSPSCTSASQELLDSEVDAAAGASDGDAVSCAPVAAQVDRSTPELQQEIDSALAEITHGLQTLEKQQKLKRDAGVAKQPLPPPRSTTAASATDTPDLVLGLPVGSAQSPATSPKDRATESAAISTAEVFANSNQSTMKKTGAKNAAVTSSATVEMSSSTGSVPVVFQQNPSLATESDEVALLSRTASTASSARQKPKVAKRNERHMSDPEVTSQPPPMFQPRVVQHVEAPQTRVEAVATETPSPKREMTPPKVAPKPSLKVKPPTMRKTFKSPEAWKKLTSAQVAEDANQSQ